MQDNYLFLKRFFSNPSSIGSVLPSSKKLAMQMIKMANRECDSELRFLEVGAGSGALTKHLIKKLREKDTLDIVELDPHFCRALKRKYGHLPQVHIHETSILDFDQKQYDVVVTSLPLNAFTSSLVDQIFLKYKDLVKSGGYVSYFEYIGLGKIKELCLTGDPQSDFKTTLVLKESFIKSYCTESSRIWWNFPPARVFHCQF